MTLDCPKSPAATIAAVRSALDEVFARLDALCTVPDRLLDRRPAYPQAWTVAEHLEHVSLVNHFLLLTVGKGVATALRRARTQAAPAETGDLGRLVPISDPGAFPWEPPAHMLPTGTKEPAEVRALLGRQHDTCLVYLERMGNGVGALCAFRISVYNLGKLDMYEWLYFLAQHGRWHLGFLARRENGECSNKG